jgi:hypothetical protein
VAAVQFRTQIILIIYEYLQLWLKKKTQTSQIPSFPMVSTQHHSQKPPLKLAQLLDKLFKCC